MDRFTKTLLSLRYLICASVVLASCSSTSMSDSAASSITSGRADPSVQQLDPSNPEDVIRINIKQSCSLQEGVDTVFWWHGKMYSRRPGERDRHLFNVQGMNVRACDILKDPKRGLGFRSVSREVMFYLDPETNEVVDTWVNPWSNEEVRVIQVANDPVSMNINRPSYAYDEDGNPSAQFRSFEHNGYYLNGGGAARLFYKNPLAGEYQDYVGGTYHAMEFGTGASPIDDVLDANADYIKDRVISWARVSKWLPWMKMGDRDGVAIFHTAGMRLGSWDELPDVVKNEILENYPEYVTAPPLDDDRPNETSWTVTQKAIDSWRAEGTD